MDRAAKFAIFLLLAFLPHSAPAADKPPQRTAREALKPFNDLIGSWRAVGSPEGNPLTGRKVTWQETIRWEWQFKDNDAWLK